MSIVMYGDIHEGYCKFSENDYYIFPTRKIFATGKCEQSNFDIQLKGQKLMNEQ